MKSKKSSLRAALFLALIGAAFAFTACWQGTPAGGSDIPGGGGGGSGGGNTASSIEGITWKFESYGSTMTLVLKGGNVHVVFSAYGSTIVDDGKYTINGNTITFSGFKSSGKILNRKFEYEIEDDEFTLSDTTGGTTYQFKKA